MSNTTSPALPAFSYAQAARGLNPARATQTQQSSAQSSSTPSEKGSNAKDRPSSTPDVSSLELNAKPADALRTEEAAQDAHKDKSTTADTTSSTHMTDVTPVATDKENVPLTSTSARSQPQDTKAADVPASSAVQLESSSVSLKAEDHATATHNGTSDSWERESQVSTAVEKATQTVEKAKSKDADDEWEKLSATNASEKELKAAPVPTVNVWHQRKEAQEAKLRDQAAARANTHATAKGHGDGAEPTKAKSSDKATSTSMSTSASTVDRDHEVAKKPTDSAKSVHEGRREVHKAQQTRPASKDGPAPEPLLPPPAVGDAVSWPTPDTAGLDERRKSVVAGEKVDKAESKPSTGKKWERVPFVPTVKFETTLPPVARRGGRLGPRGRDGTGRGGHAAQNSLSLEKSDLAGTMGPPPPRQSHEQERGRKQDTPRNERSNSVPTQTRKAVSASGMHGGSRRVPELTAKPDRKTGPDPDHHHKKDPLDSATVASPVDANPATAARQPDHSTAGAHATANEDRKSSTAPEEDPGTPAPRRGHAGLASQPNRDPTREAPASRGREYRRDKSESSHDKVESWRDRDSAAENSSRRDTRTERGRAGYRGRGSYATYHVPVGHQAMSAPLPQQPFSSSSRSYSNNEGRRQSSQPYAYMQPPAHPRGALRSQSIPIGALPQTMTTTVPSIAPPLAPLQTDLGLYGYPPLMHPGIMSAMPYNAALDTYALYSMVSTQLEYYFSIDNLCKDIFLRSNMDSQGYVPLSVIANFKRMKALTDDLDLLRYACSQSRDIDFRPGDHGDDLLRRRGDWRQWVLNMDERQAFARHDGPPADAASSRARGQNGQPHPRPPAPAPTMREWDDHAYATATSFVPPPLPPAGFTTLDHHLSHSPVDATLQDTPVGAGPPPEDPRATPPAAASMTSPPSHELNGTASTPLANGTHGSTRHPAPADENVFPDDQIPTLYVYKREEAAGAVASARPPIMSNADDGSHEPASAHFVTGLRGGAASPGQLEHLSRRPTTAPAPDGPGIFWLKDGISQHDFDAQGSLPWLYQSIHARAAAQRVPGYVNDDLEILYQFWSGFLVDNFNARMYADFHRLALEDLQLGLTSGSTHLAHFYGALLASDKPLSDRIAHDLVQLAVMESGDHRPAFQKLRSAWRNGAFNLKSRKTIDKILDAAVRAELEQ